MFKKLATLVCATAMAVSALTGVVANAAVERDNGINLVAEKSGDNKVKLDVYAVGFTTVINYGLRFSVSGATLTNVTAEHAAISGDYNAVFINGSRFNSVAAAASAVALNDKNIILTLELTFSEDITNDITITLSDDSSGNTVNPGNGSLEYYAEDLESDPSYVTLGFNDAVVKGTPAITPAAVTAVEKQQSVTGTGEFETQTADIYGVEITPYDESVKGAKVAFGDNSKVLNFKTVYSGKGTVVFAVILASESGADLPTLTADNVTPITAVE